MSANYTIVRGYVHHGTTIYKSSLGWQYKLANNTDRTVYLKCASKDCRGTASIIKATDTLTEKREHNHDTESYKSLTDIRNNLKEAARKDRTNPSLRAIFDDVTRNHPDGGKIAFGEVELGMYRARRRAQPPVPRTAAEFVVLMSDRLAENYKQHFKGAVELGTELAIIFMSTVIIPRLAEVQHAFYDGTFFCVPVLFYQLFSILAVFGDKTLPVVSVLMTGKSEALYHKVTAKIRLLAPDFAPDTFMGDFEMASRNALRASFPNARFGGCQFHYSQALWRKAQKLGLTDLYKNNQEFKIFLKKLMATPYLPANQIRDIALTLFDQPIHVNSHTRTNIRKFRQYFFRYWLNTVTPEKFSVHDFAYGTNNFSESFHARLKARIRVHQPSMWSFVGHINNMISDTEKDLDRLDRGLNVSRPRKKAYVTNLQRRNFCKEKYANGEYSHMQFISAVAHTMDTHLLQLNAVTTQIEEDSDEALQDHSNQETSSSQQQDHRLCAVCLAPRERTICFRPCNHAQVCASCSSVMESMGSPCPICRVPVQERFEIFLQ